MTRSEIRSLEAITRRIKILELLEEQEMTTRMIYELLKENKGRIMEDMIRLKEWGCIQESGDKRLCQVGNKLSWYYTRTDTAYDGYDFLKEISQRVDVEAALKDYRLNFGMFNAGQSKLESKEVYNKVPGNPNATIVLNSNRPVGFYSYQKPKANVNRGIGSTFSLYDEV